MKRIHNFILLALVLLLVFTGCSSGVEKEPTPTDNSDTGSQVESNEDAGDEANLEPVTLKFWRPGTDEATENYWKSAIEEYEKMNTHITIELTSVPWGNEMDTKLNAGYASGTGPDVLAYAVASIAQRAQLGQYEDLGPYIDKWEGKEDIYPNVLEIGSHKGNVYGLGFSPDPRIFIWRKDFFNEVGLDPDSPPTTWEELDEYARLLTVKEGNVTIRGGFDIPVTNTYQILQIFGNQNGGKTMDVENNNPTFDSPAFIEAAEFLTNLVIDGINVPWDQHSGLNPMEQGIVAMTYAGPGIVKNLINNDPEMADKIGVSAPLSRVKKGTFCGFQLMFINQDSQYKEESWNFIEFVLSKEEMWRRQTELGTTVVRQSLEEDYIALDPEINKAILGAIQYGEAVPKVPYAGKVVEAMSFAMEKAFFQQLTPEEALIEAADKLRSEIPSLINE